MKTRIIRFGLILLLLCGCAGYEQASAQTTPQNEVEQFLQTMNPDLHKKVQEIQAEIERTSLNIALLKELRQDYPRQAPMIDNIMRQWEGLLQKLNTTLADIRNQVERTFVAYQISKIQGQKTFDEMSKSLLQSANSVLNNAQDTKSIIERELYE